MPTAKRSSRRARPAREIPPAVGWTWDATAMRYRSPAGTFVSRASVRAGVDQVLQKSENRGRALARQMQGGALALDDWAAAMRAEIKRAHLTSAAAARGGWAQMTAADYGRVGATVAKEYRYLDRFAREIASGKVALNGQFVARAGMYSEAGRMTYHVAETVTARGAGYDEEHNVFGPVEHCKGAGSCTEEHARGWVPIGALKQPGSRKCLRRCRCRKVYRDSRTGEESPA